MEATVIPQQANDNRPQEGLSSFRYGWNFAKALVKDNKFWSRSGATLTGMNLLAQGAIGGFFLLSAPLTAQILGFAGCAVLAGLGIAAISFGFPGAWQRLENLCEQTFPKFNPLKRIRTSLSRARRKDDVRHAALPPARKGLIGRMKSGLQEHHVDMFLSGVTLEGASVATVVWGYFLMPTVLSLPALTIAGGIGLTVGVWNISLGLFDIFNSTKTMMQAIGTHRQGRKKAKAANKAAKATAPSVPPPQPEKATSLPAATTAFNDNAAPDKQETTPPAVKPPTPARRVANGPKNQ